jgi:adenylate cyclase class 2
VKDQELEVKFHLSNLNALEQMLRGLGAPQSQVRTHEINLRFDTPDLALTRSLQVLRLRMDSRARVTYKGPGWDEQGVRARRELEFEVSDYNQARSLFEALGYQVSMMYEKYRAVYELERVHVTLDEMPFGAFAELEGPDSESIQAVASRLGLSWQSRVLDSYTAIFESLREKMGFSFRDLSFENFHDLTAPLDAIGISPADRQG